MSPIPLAIICYFCISKPYGKNICFRRSQRKPAMQTPGRSPLRHRIGNIGVTVHLRTPHGYEQVAFFDLA